MKYISFVISQAKRTHDPKMKNKQKISFLISVYFSSVYKHFNLKCFHLDFYRLLLGHFSSIYKFRFIHLLF